jgi:hypothetical protein
MAKIRRRMKNRLIQNHRADPTGEWRDKRKKQLGVDPYNKPLERRSAPKQKRRSLDDMRRLNDEIKAAKLKTIKG